MQPLHLPKRKCTFSLASQYKRHDTVRHELNSLEGETHSFSEVQLDSNNITRGDLCDRKKVIVLVDSGATRTLISWRTIQNSPYLSKLSLTKIETLRFRVGNGALMTSNTTITFDLRIQGVKLTLTAVVLDNLGGFDIVVGTPTLRELGCV